MTKQQDNTVSLLWQIVERRGMDYLREGGGKFFVNAFSEMGGDKQDVRLLRYLTECGAHEDLLDAAALTPAMQRAYYSQAVQKLCDKALISENLAHRICGIFWQAVYKAQPPVAAPVPPMPESKQSAYQPKPLASKKDELVKNPLVDTGKKEESVPAPPKPKPRRFSWKKLALLGLAVLLVLALISVVTGGDSGKRTRSDLKPYNLEDSIEDMLLAGTEEIYTYPDGTWMEFYYDDAGHEIYRVYVNTENDIENLFEARYDDSGRLVYHQSFDGEGNLLRADSYDFHSSEDTAQRRITLDDGRSFQGQSTFDENGYETFTLNHQDGTLTVYVYKDGGVLTRRASYDAEGNAPEVTSDAMQTGIDWENVSKVYGPRQTVVGWTNDNGYTRSYVQGLCGGALKEYSVSVDAGFIETYDPMGNQVGELYYTDGQLKELGSNKIFSYDQQGNFSGAVDTFYFGDGHYNISTYDANWIEISREVHYFDGEEESVTYHRYETELDDQGRQIQVQTFDGETGQLISIDETEYDREGNVAKETRTYYHEDGMYNITVQDGDRKTLSDITYYPSGSIYSMTEYTTEGTQKKWTWYYENGQVETVREYNAQGGNARYISYYESGQTQQLVEYNDAGELRKVTWYYENGKMQSVNEYNDAGELMKAVSYYENGNVKWHREYNVQGEVIKAIHYNEDGTVYE